MKTLLFLVGCGVMGGVYGSPDYFIQQLSRYVPVSDTLRQTIKRLNTSPEHENKIMTYNWLHDRPLFRGCPAFVQNIPCIELGDMPTPIMRLTRLESLFHNRVQLYQKDDGRIGKVKEGERSFGGNKIRKLEFLLADAVAHGARSVMTYGCIGSNHVVATAASAQKVGLRCIAQLSPQAVTDVVKRNMLLMGVYDTQIILNPTREVREMQTICSVIQNEYTQGDIPYLIPTGGSCPIGIIGFVNAVFELKEQINEGLMPEPDYIYVPMGSCGTVVGLMLGVRAAGLCSQVVGIAVEPDDPQKPFLKKVQILLQQTNRLLHEKDALFPFFEWHEEDIYICLAYGGTEYGVVTPQAQQAIELFKQTESIQLDPTYTGKAAAGMLADLSSGAVDDKVVLFWNTFCAEVATPTITYDQLPHSLHQFFT